MSVKSGSSDRPDEPDQKDEGIYIGNIVFVLYNNEYFLLELIIFV